MPFPLFGGPRLITANVLIATGTETTTQDNAGGSVPVFVARATKVKALYSQISGGRPGDFHSDNERTRATFRADEGFLGQGDIRIQITAALDPKLADLVGTYWRVDSTASHPAGRGGLEPASDAAACSNYQVPATV